MSTQIAKTIISQLGGNKFVVMTGARNFVATENGVRFRIPGKGFAKNSINHIQIELQANDTYKMCFDRIHGMKMTTVEIVSDVYCDMLCDVFESVTGLRTSL